MARTHARRFPLPVDRPDAAGQLASMKWILALALIGTFPAQAQRYKVLHAFTGSSLDGANPYAKLTLDPAGGLYGTTEMGGASGFGVVFTLDSTGTFAVLHSFAGGVDGRFPGAHLIRDAAGYLYGTTSEGGASEAGIVFRLDTAGTETVLYTFSGGADGYSPLAGLTRDPAGNLYGTTVLGGEANQGVAFKLSTTGKETVLYNFGGPQGSYPKAGLTWDPAGHLYGTTYNGGTTACTGNGCGVVYRLSLSGKETVLDDFTGASDGVYPISGLIRDSAGNLYGTASMGGAVGYGTVFKVDATGAETVLHNFTPYEPSK